MVIHNFQERLEFSFGIREKTDLMTVKKMISGCTKVIKTEKNMDRQGVDYIAYLRNGAEIYIDAKSRDKGVSQYWKNDIPELTLEKWSVMPGGKYNIRSKQARTGWTLCEKKNVDYILYTFDPEDSIKAFLVPYQLLRIAFRKYADSWFISYPQGIADSGRWQTQNVFVPYPIVYNAINEVSQGIIINTKSKKQYIKDLAFEQALLF